MTPPVTAAERLGGRARLGRALRPPWSRGQAVAAVLLAVLGFAGVAQVRATQNGNEFVGAREADLIALINRLSLATDRARGEIAEMEATRDALRDDAEATRTALRLAREQAETLGILAGTLPATGPGVRITIESASGEVGTDELLNGLEELQNAGAEAVEINDTVRVVAETGIQDAEQGLLVGGEPVRPPYVVEAIGDPETLATAVGFSGGFQDNVEAAGGRLVVQRLDRVEVATTRALSEPRFAEPVEPGEEG